MYTPDNYIKEIANVDFSRLPEVLQKGHMYVMKATQSGMNWENYQKSESVRKVIDGYFDKLAVFNGQKGITALAPAKTSAPTQKTAKREAKPIKPATQKPRSASKSTKPYKDEPLQVSRIPEEIRFIKRFVGLHNKTKSKEDILRFINALQKAIVEKRIRKTSEWAEHIKFIQDRLLDTFNNMGKSTLVKLKDDTLEALKKFAKSEVVLSSVGFIKRYINLHGKPGMKEKAKLLLGQINRAYEKGKIASDDPYGVEMYELRKNLETFVGTKDKTLEIEEATLHGLNGILGCACRSLSGLDEVKPTVMNSMDFANLQFKTLGLTGKWFDLIGDPSTNFTAMVFGKPKMGKSYLCVDFAGYLARNHGKVLYVAKEEGLDKTLQEKIDSVKHPNLDVSSMLLPDLNPYQFIFLDSVNKLGLKPDDLTRLKAQYPEKAFVYVFQSTKLGNFRGANTFQHDVDAVIEVPEIGKAVQYGRFNQGGEMRIFNENESWNQAA